MSDGRTYKTVLNIISILHIYINYIQQASRAVSRYHNYQIINFCMMAVPFKLTRCSQSRPCHDGGYGEMTTIWLLLSSSLLLLLPLSSTEIHQNTSTIQVEARIPTFKIQMAHRRWTNRGHGRELPVTDQSWFTPSRLSPERLASVYRRDCDRMGITDTVTLSPPYSQF